MFYLAGGDIRLHRQRKYVNQLVGVRPGQMGPENTVAPMFDQNLALS